METYDWNSKLTYLKKHERFILQ
ncbi:Protein of unknown function [Bacillus wiedmannii]|uniref:Uncharacterized protein n=1 Tax=Bacillus wiedmannii TaxID=1890302 RepID=A0AB37YS24_9BACI|nr:Protein of unknown function [Bacillus wiedmannii]